MKALLALEDGFVLEGRSFTGPCEGGGEVIFNTGMTGYQEILTDPSYYGQMVCMTWPLIGNYGISAEDMESGKVHAAALIVKECCKTPSNWRSVCSLPDFLQQHGVPGIEGIDTRALTRHLRMHGAMRGMVSTSITDPAELVMQAKSLPSMEGQNLVTRVMPATPWKWTGNGGVPAELNADGSYNWPGEGPRLVAYDFGIKWNILRLLTEQGFDVLVVPPSFTAEQVKASGAQAVFLSNGPGDPATLTDEIVTIKKLVESYPVAGICLGHQLLGHALGGTTRKLKFGHHGCNHPVKDLSTGHVEISSQNHGFCVDIDNVSDVVVARKPERRHAGRFCPQDQAHPRRAAPPRGLPRPHRQPVFLRPLPRHGPRRGRVLGFLLGRGRTFLEKGESTPRFPLPSPNLPIRLVLPPLPKLLALLNLC